MAGVVVFRKGAELQRIKFIEEQDPVYQSTIGPDNDRAAVDALIERVVHRARGAIALGRVDELRERRFQVLEPPSYVERSDDYIRRRVLIALDNIARASAGGRRLFVGLDDIGICLFENIDPKHMAYVLMRLEREGLIKSFSDQQKPGNQPLEATAAGLREADALRGISSGPGLLMEETIALAESMLDRYSPAIAERLREITKRIYESRELSHADVGEIAQALDLAIQDFVDIDAFWEGVSETRPSRELTRDRLSMIIARGDSKTEKELIIAHLDYLFAWLGPLDKFVNKHRHPDPAFSNRFHAKRMLLYSYMLMADVIELLGLK
jgi:hypothetical protein